MNQSIFVRRCHVCGEVSESTDDITKCLFCSKPLLPFFYFDRKKVSEYGDNQALEPIAADLPGYGPIKGLTVYW